MEEDKLDQDPNKKKLGDKIFGAHNNPTKDFEFDETFDVDQDHRFLETCYDEEEYIHRKKLKGYLKLLQNIHLSAYR